MGEIILVENATALPLHFFLFFFSKSIRNWFLVMAHATVHTILTLVLIKYEVYIRKFVFFMNNTNICHATHI